MEFQNQRKALTEPINLHKPMSKISFEDGLFSNNYLYY
jgi:hypothetical protein